MTVSGISTGHATKLLLLLSRIEFTDEEKLEAEKECRSLHDWKLFAELAIKQGVAALVWQNMSDLSFTSFVPEQERIMLEEARLKTIARVSYITSAAAEVVTALEEEGIKALLLKGLALEHTIYRSRGLRQMSDADLLVPREDILRARDKLLRAGFVSDELKSPLYRHIILDFGNHLPELNRGGMSVDLHHSLFGSRGTGIVKKAVMNPDVIRAAGREFFVPPPRTSFLGLVSHIHKHAVKGEFQLRLYTDLWLLASKYRERIFNENLIPEAAEAGIMDGLRAVLTDLDLAYGLSIPDGLKEMLVTGKTGTTSFTNYLADPGTLKPFSQKQIFQENLKSLKGLKRKMIFVLGDLFPSPGFMKSRYGCRTTFSTIFFYPLRLGKLIWVFGAFFARSRVK